MRKHRSELDVALVQQVDCTADLHAPGELPMDVFVRSTVAAIRACGESLIAEGNAMLARADRIEDLDAS